MIKKLMKHEKSGKLKTESVKELCTTRHRKQNLIICKSCGKLKPHNAKGLCSTCYQHKTGKSQPMNKNKSCASYLGVVVAEQVLSKVFKDVQRMPPQNPGFDFKCSKGMKVDVKSSTLQFYKRLPNYKGYWHFFINKNKNPDYFLCIAFDNRISLTPQHLWLIPSKKVRHLKTLGISKLQTHKWSQYEQPIDKVISCCDELKEK